MMAPALPKGENDASVKLLEGKVKHLDEEFTKQYKTVETLKRTMTELKDTLAKSVTSVFDEFEAKYVYLATMVKQNSNNIQNITDIVTAVVAGMSKPKVPTPTLPKVPTPSLPKEPTPSLPKEPTPSLPKVDPNGNGLVEECLNQHCFKVHKEPAIRDQAENICQQEGGHLVMAKSADLYDFVVHLKNQASPDRQFWFGAKYTDDRVWIYPDGKPVVDAVPWARNEPNDFNNYKCSHMVYGNKDDPGRKDLVADASCSSRFLFICERTTA
ncbi:MRC1 [Branchiostoma lanceolatum]|uniref:MRC1 protein n=1 Tax=Branchiostoma lanceolatum TaxID=7740 RepID=A0A8K0AAK7_BRALA|nr:MRC1 [Branchiostoma lanceolatum]